MTLLTKPEQAALADLAPIRPTSLPIEDPGGRVTRSTQATLRRGYPSLDSREWLRKGKA